MHRTATTRSTAPRDRSAPAPRPSRVFKGTRMAGRMGGQQVTTLNLEIVQADPERELILVKGAVPGPRGGMVVLRDAVKAPLVKGGKALMSPTSSPTGAIDLETASPAEIRRYLRPAPEQRSTHPPIGGRHRPGPGGPRAVDLRDRAQPGRAPPGGDRPTGRRPRRHPVDQDRGPRSVAAEPSPSARRGPVGPVRDPPGRRSGSGEGWPSGRSPAPTPRRPRRR